MSAANCWGGTADGEKAWEGVGEAPGGTKKGQGGPAPKGGTDWDGEKNEGWEKEKTNSPQQPRNRGPLAEHRGPPHAQA